LKKLNNNLMADLSRQTQKLIQEYRAWHNSLQPKTEIPTIHVDEVASAVAAFYEKIRGVVDWKEEHLMRRSAIERMLKRRLLLTKDSQEVAEPLILELIRSGHFPNDRIPETSVVQVKKIIEKYIYILENAPMTEGEKIKAQLYDWLLSIAACEIEEELAPPHRERALIDYMTEAMTERIKLNNGMTEEQKNVQIHIAVQKALFKLDNPIIIYNLIKKQYPKWHDLKNNESPLPEIAQNIYLSWKNFEKALKKRLSEKFYKICERYDTAYLVLGDVISEEPMNALQKLSAPEELESKIVSAYEKRLKTIKKRINRAAIYATISIFLTKILLALAIEVPFDRYVTGQFSYEALGFNILIPALLMLFLILTIKPPKKENLQQVIMEIMKITYETEAKDAYVIKIPKERSWLMDTFVTGFYLLGFLASFGLIIWGLQKLEFGILSMVIFLVFISLISFAGTKLRERSRELEIVQRKESFLVFIIDFFSLPIIRMGKWLSGQWAKYNVIVVFFNFLIDMPLQTFIEFLEKWREFLREKKEEIH